jgi:lipopolysaccharide/colanic/teichoic acid biosynthesis glycosyltransferase
MPSGRREERLVSTFNRGLKTHDPHPVAATMRRRTGAGRVKRGIDLAGAAFGLVLTSPLLLVVAIVIWRSMGRPILFRQVRTGLHGELFELAKFRTMREAVDANGRPLADGDRLTRLGSFLRRTSLDEWPELWNVLRGELSLVGPRPLLVEYLPLYTTEQARRHDVKPGITGWAQVNGRNAITWEEKFALDVWYVDHWSLWLDLKILLKTVHKVIAREGVAAANIATMTRFTGSVPNQSLATAHEPSSTGAMSNDETSCAPLARP